MELLHVCLQPRDALNFMRRCRACSNVCTASSWLKSLSLSQHSHFCVSFADNNSAPLPPLPPFSVLIWQI